MAEPALLPNPDPDAPQLIGGENGAQAFQSIEQPTGERTVGPVPRATMVEPAQPDFGMFSDLVPESRLPVSGMDFGAFSDLVPQPPPSSTPEADTALNETARLPVLGALKGGSIQHAPEELAPGILRNAADAAGEVGKEFAQGLATPMGVANLVSPLPGAYEGVKHVVDLLRGVPIAEAIPESQRIKQTETTPPFSKERFKTGFQMLTEMAMAAGGVKGLEHTARGPAVAEAKPLPVEEPLQPNVPEGYARVQQLHQAVPENQDYANDVPRAETLHNIPANQPRKVAVQNEGGQLPSEQYPETPQQSSHHWEHNLEQVVHQSQSETLHTFSDKESGTEARIYRGINDEFNVVLHDIDANQTVPVAQIFKTEQAAIDYAKSLSGGDKIPSTGEGSGPSGMEAGGDPLKRGDSLIQRGNEPGNLPAAPPLNKENLYYEKNLQNRAYQMAQGFVWNGQDWVHPDYPGKTVYSSDVPPPKRSEVRRIYEELKGEATPNAIQEPTQGAQGAEVGQRWYQGVGPKGEPSSWVTSNLEKAKIYARRRGSGGTINVFTPEQIGETAFADQEGNLLSPQEYVKTQSEDTTIQTLGREGKLPKPIESFLVESPPETPRTTGVAPEPSNDWTTATEPVEQHATRLKLKADKEGGFVNADILQEVADFGVKIYQKGVDFVKWSAEMIRHLGEKVKPHLQAVWDSLLGRNLLPGRGESGAIGGIGIRKRSELDKVTGERSAKLQRSFADAERAQKQIEQVASERRQNAISAWMEVKGNQAELAKQAASAKGKMFKRAVTDAQKLTPKEIALAQKARDTFDVLEKRGHTYDVLSAHRDNYVPHVWDVTKKMTGFGSGRLQSQFKFNKARTFNTFFEGDQAGWTPKTMAIGKLLPTYLHEMNRVIADRQFVQDVQGARATTGEPLVIPRGRVSNIETDTGGKAYLVNPHTFKTAKDAAGNPVDQSQYKVRSDQPSLTNWRWEGKDAQGNPIFMQDDLAIHPELDKRIEAMMGQSAIKNWYNRPSSGMAVIPKAIAKGLDRAQSVMKREMFGLLAPFHQVQEGTHAVGHTVNPFGGMEKMGKLTPAHIDAAEHGLMLKPDTASGQHYMEGVGGQSSFVAQISRKFGGPAGRMVANTIDGYQKYFFHQYIPALKFKTYEHIQARNMKRYAKDIAKGEVTESDVKMLSAQQTNAAYGHINYSLLDRDPTIQHFLQLGLLAPDFLEARARFVGQSLKTLAGSKAGTEQFRAIAVLAAAQAGTAFVLAQLTGGEWDGKRPFEMTLNNRTYTLRSVPEDFFRFAFEGPDVRREFVSARMNPVLAKVEQARTGRNYRGEKTTFLATVGELLANYIPITARWLPGMRNLTETSRNSPISPVEQLAGTLGLKVSRYSPITKVYQMAHEWSKAEGKPVDTGVYPVSKYQQLRYALEDDDSAKAETEFRKLMESKKRADVLSGFHESLNHPFTTSKAEDIKFRNSLGEGDREIYNLAVDRRKEILRRFNAMKANVR